MNTFVRIFMFFLLFGGLIMAGCSKKEDSTIDTPKKTEPREALEKYLLEEARLDSFGWKYYSVEQKSSSLYAYIIFPASGQRMAPVESELRRVCPDSKLHDFWQDTHLESFELILIKNVDAKHGKATRLVQLTCDAGFDLVAFEATTIDSPKKVEEEGKNVLSVSFDKVDEHNNAVFTITNISGRDIDDIGFVLKLLDAQGKVETGITYTNQMPGMVYLKTGDSKKFYLRPVMREAVFEKLAIDPDAFKPVIKVMEVTYF